MSSPFAFTLRRQRAQTRAVRFPRRAGLVRLALLLVAVFVIAGGGWMLVRDASVVRVTDVEVSGLRSSQSARVRSALDAAARTMTTLHVRRQALDDAVAPYSSVASLRISTHFPHGLRIAVVERAPVAALTQGKERIPVTRDGTVLSGVVADHDLPTIRLAKPVVGKRVPGARALGALEVVGTAPKPLLHAAEQVFVDARGVVVDLRDGPELVFGSGRDATAKWAAAARVLAEPSSAGATYLDLRVPGRVAAGGLAPIEDPPVDPNAQVQGENG